MIGDRDHASANLATPKPSPAALRPNPFTTYRDPDTGRWVVVLPSKPSPDKSSLPSNFNLIR